MLTPSGRGPQPPDLGKKLAALQRNIEHVDRKLSGFKPVTPGGSALSGFTRAKATAWYSSAGAIEFGKWTFDTGWNATDDNTASAPSMASVDSVAHANSGVFGPVEPGFYSLRGHLYVDGLVSSAVQATWNYAPDGQGGAVQVDNALAPSPNGTDAWVDTLTLGAVYLPASSERMPLGCQLVWDGGTTVTGSVECWIDVYRYL